jgi:hypothetical protein
MCRKTVKRKEEQREKLKILNFRGSGESSKASNMGLGSQVSF